jgi:hypothetical protein
MGLGSGIRYPGSGKNLFRIQGSKRHRIPDPQHCVQLVIYSVPVRLSLLQPLQELCPLALQCALPRLQRLDLLLHRGKLAVDARKLLS